MLNLIKKWPLFAVALTVHILFYMSIWHSSHFMNIFFPIGQLHQNYVGLDFYQLPKGAYDFYRYGKSLEGGDIKDPDGFTKGRLSNKNVYHPLLTLTLGGILQLFSPENSILIWQIFKLLITLLTVLFLCRKFLDNKHLDLALFIYLVFFPQYQELKIAQYQFLANHLILYGLLLIKHSKLKSSLLLMSSLLIKPIILPWYFVLFTKSHFKYHLFFLILFLAITLPLYFFQSTNYYFTYVNHYLFGSYIEKATDFYSLSVLLHKIWDVPSESVRYLKFALIVGISFLALVRKIPLTTVLLGYTICFLLFGFRIYEYHYTILIPLLVYGLIFEKSFHNSLSKTLVVMCAMPSLFVFFNVFNIGINIPNEISEFMWPWVSMSRIFPIFVLLGWLIILEFGNKLSINDISNSK